MLPSGEENQDMTESEMSDNETEDRALQFSSLLRSSFRNKSVVLRMGDTNQNQAPKGVFVLSLELWEDDAWTLSINTL